MNFAILEKSHQADILLSILIIKYDFNEHIEEINNKAIKTINKGY